MGIICEGGEEIRTAKCAKYAKEEEKEVIL
jgi:hypothetical protein